MRKSLPAIAFALAALTAAPVLAQTSAAPPTGPMVVQPRIIVPPQNCQSAAQASWVTFQWHEANQLCSGNPWSAAPVRCVEALQNFSIPVWQAVGVCRNAH